ncbi:hypothetical protein GLOIN_2v1835889 [Rhizophagus irregularis DAOM 181602=DAOM 197198]|uniref:Uncharacterized protein n=1 Tax=Rhizophagus irregularis (strain DAOM 181602 / DAOM 197198 / MUCL 43194) TaxID=747089 RepID=A0A2P4QR38_RHIID|nr:hypothetical protein GLOIN_2v1835889 [Rhizophagus irregularis DAOM 181602=DAOM 197198]POG80038.1 hypothetical protein GLOIN_2v1835889 [Rhizophagus irregularis DAOM 181602=DAOM 197198]|eukprot:XP_025186904.1 hypothetical protein GLOIN_2v1835889 [Rhizophagus irregularis DAOM 181602=DAOM 197198]
MIKFTKSSIYFIPFISFKKKKIILFHLSNMASYNEIVLEISEAVKIIDFREEFMKQNATKLLFPTVTKSYEREAEIVRQVTNWRIVNRHLVGHYGGPSGAYIVPNGAGGTNILGPDASIVLIQRFNMIKYKTVCMFLHHLFDFYLFLKFIIVGGIITKSSYPLCHLKTQISTGRSKFYGRITI